MEQFNFRVVPCVYKRGYCPTYVQTLEDAIAEQMFWNEHTDFPWAVEGLNERAVQELNDYWDKEADEYESN